MGSDARAEGKTSKTRAAGRRRDERKGRVLDGHSEAGPGSLVLCVPVGRSQRAPKTDKQTLSQRTLKELGTTINSFESL